MSLLRVEDVHKSYDDLRVLRGITFQMDRGEIKVIIGPSGTGKSTLLNILSGVDLGYTGGAKVFGRPPSDLSVKKMRGIVFQEHKMDGYLSGREHLLAHGSFYKIPKKEIEAASTKLLGFMDLKDCANRPVKTYSSGMIRRLEIARALLHKPKVLLLDEPTSDLDVNIKKKIWQHLKELKAGFNLSVLLATHDLKEAAELGDRVIILENGAKKAELSKNQVNEKRLTEMI